MDQLSLTRRAAAEFVGTAFLTLAIIGSGIAAFRLSHGDQGFTLVANAIATGLVLVAIILAIESVSGGQLNPAVTLLAWMTGGLSRSEAGVYALAQLGGAVLGAIVANVVFGLAALDVSQHVRSGWELWTSEVVATFGLVVVIFGIVRSGRSAAVHFAVGAYIAAAILFTSFDRLRQSRRHGCSFTHRHVRGDRPTIGTDVRDRGVRWGRAGPGRHSVPVPGSDC